MGLKQKMVLVQTTGLLRHIEKEEVKVRLFVCFAKHHAMKTTGGGGIAPYIPDFGTMR